MPRTSQKAAERWAAAIEKRILTLERFPLRYEVIPEAAELAVEYRHALEGNYRIIYRVAGDRVIVMRVFRAARLLDLSMLER